MVIRNSIPFYKTQTWNRNSTPRQKRILIHRQLSLEWSVREITIEDHYEINLNATYETDAPASVLLRQPLSINLPKMSWGGGSGSGAVGSGYQSVPGLPPCTQCDGICCGTNGGGSGAGGGGL
jgi:hypothetical protein